MTTSASDSGGKKVLDCRATDNDYLHKDFHGALAYAIEYLDATYGPSATTAYLEQVAKAYFSPLSQAMQRGGLSAMESHLREIFGHEQGKFVISYEDGGQTLVMAVAQCPAVAHLRATNQWRGERFCATTEVVNATICKQAGYVCSCRVEAGGGRCVQKFWKAKA